MLGDIINGYEIIEEIGGGEVSIVYKARNLESGEFIAIKVLKDNFKTNQEVRNRFLKEAAVHNSLDHENIVKIYDFFEQDQHLYMIMEFIEGYNLHEYIKNVTGPMTPEKANIIFPQIVEAMAYLHNKGIIHRDIKPGNVIIKGDKVKVLDFGVSKFSNQPDIAKLTTANTDIGSPMYMSPEQVVHSGVTFKSDIYSLGVLLFEMITGKPPYDNSTELRKNIIFEPLPSVTTIYEYAEEKYDEIIAKATAKKAEERYSSCEELLAEFEKSAGVVSSNEVTEEILDKKEQSEVTSDETKPKNKNIYWIGFGLLALIAVVFTYLILSNDNGDQSNNLGNNDIENEIRAREDSIKRKYYVIKNSLDDVRSYGPNLSRTRFEAELPHLKACYNVLPRFDSLVNTIGFCYYQLDSFDQAETYFKEACTLNASFTEPHINLAKMYVKQRNFSSAKVYYDKALLIVTDNAIKAQLEKELEIIKTYL